MANIDIQKIIDWAMEQTKGGDIFQREEKKKKQSEDERNARIADYDKNWRIDHEAPGSTLALNRGAQLKERGMIDDTELAKQKLANTGLTDVRNITEEGLNLRNKREQDNTYNLGVYGIDKGKGIKPEHPFESWMRNPNSDVSPENVKKMKKLLGYQRGDETRDVKGFDSDKPATAPAAKKETVKPAPSLTENTDRTLFGDVVNSLPKIATPLGYTGSKLLDAPGTLYNYLRPVGGAPQTLTGNLVDRNYDAMRDAWGESPEEKKKRMERRKGLINTNY